MNTHKVVVDFGKHKGMLWTRVPKDYLRWLANQGVEHRSLMAKAELERRGTKISSAVDISPHAIDRASVRCRKAWHQSVIDPDEGIYSWLSRTCVEALEKAGGRPERLEHNDVVLCFQWGEIYPILKTVLPAKHGS